MPGPTPKPLQLGHDNAVVDLVPTIHNHVARVLGQLGDDVVATGLLGGHMGAYMAELMDAHGINNDFVPIKGETRICLNILHAGNQTELRCV